MKYLDEYRDEALAQKIVAEIRRTVTRPWTLRPPLECSGRTSDFSGVVRVTSTKSATRLGFTTAAPRTLNSQRRLSPMQNTAPIMRRTALPVSRWAALR